MYSCYNNDFTVKSFYVSKCILMTYSKRKYNPGVNTYSFENESMLPLNNFETHIECITSTYALFQCLISFKKYCEILLH